MSREIAQDSCVVNRHPLMAAVLLIAGLTACAPKGEALYTRAEQALQKGDVNAAIIDLKNYVEADPENARGRALLGKALVEAGDLQAGEIEIRKAKDLGAPRELTLVPECKVLVGKSEFDAALEQCRPEAGPADAKVDLHIIQGQALLGLNRPEDAKAQFASARSANPDSVEAVLGLALASHAGSGLSDARAVLDEAPESVRGDVRYWLAAGEINLRGGDFTAAEAAYTAALEHATRANRSDERMQSRAGLVDAQLRQGKVKEALATSDALLKSAPSSWYAKLVRAQALAAGREFEQARLLLEDVVSKQPGHLGARMFLGMVNLQQGNLGQAEMNFANVVANDPTNVRAQRLLAETRAQVQSPQQALTALGPALEKTPDPTLLALAGRLSLASGEREKAMSYFTRALAGPESQQTVELRLEIAGGYVVAGEFDRAIGLLKDIPPGAAPSHQREYLLMLALLRKGDKNEAVAEGNALIERSGNDPAARNLVAGVLTAAGQADAGRAQLNEALEAKPDDPQTLFNLARLDLAEGKTADAEGHFTQILAADPKNLDATMGAAAAAGAGGDGAGAEKWLQKAVEDHPASTAARVALAEARQRRGDVGGAIELYEQGLVVKPDDPVLLNNLAVLYQQKSDPRALEIAERAYRQAPNAPALQDTYGWILVTSGTLEQALPVLRSAATALPGMTEVQYHYAAALAKTGNEAEALAILRRLDLEQIPTPARIDAQKLLDELSK